MRASDGFITRPVRSSNSVSSVRARPRLGDELGQGVARLGARSISLVRASVRADTLFRRRAGLCRRTRDLLPPRRRDRPVLHPRSGEILVLTARRRSQSNKRSLTPRPQESSTSLQKGLALSAEESVAVLARPVEPRRE